MNKHFEFSGEEFGQLVFRNDGRQLTWVKIKIEGVYYKIWKYVAEAVGDILCGRRYNRHVGSIISIDVSDGWVTGLKFEKVNKQNRFSTSINIEYKADNETIDDRGFFNTL